MKITKLDKIRVNVDNAINYIPLVSTVNNVINLIQRRVFANIPEAEISLYQKHIVDKTKNECLIQMLPLGKIFYRIAHRKPEQQQQQQPLSDIHGKTLVELKAMTMHELFTFLSTPNDANQTPLALETLLPVILDTLSTQDIQTLFIHINEIPANIFHSLSKKQALRLMAIFVSSGPKPTPAYLELVPAFVREYAKLVASASNDSYLDARDIKFSTKLTDEERLAAIAFIVDVKKIPIAYIYNITPVQTVQLAPHLRYLDLTTIGWELGNNLLKNCPNVNVLKFNQADSLKDIHQLPQLQELDGHSTRTLIHLTTEMPALRTLNLSSCLALESLPAELPLLETLNCRQCNNLRQIPALLPRVTTIDVEYCSNLMALPDELPLCTDLNYNYCPNILNAPQVPQGAHVTCTVDPHAIVNVETENFSSNPRDILMRVGGFILRNGTFPKLRYFDNGLQNEAIDAGGLKRDCVTRLCKNIFIMDVVDDTQELFLKIAADRKPLLIGNNRSEVTAYRALGAIMASCFDRHYDIKTGPLFHQEVYQYVSAPFVPRTDNWFLHNFLLTKLSPESLRSLLDAESALSPFTENDLTNLSYLLSEDMTREYVQTKRNEIRQELLDMAKADPSLQAISWIAKELRERVLGADVFQDAQALQTMIEGVLTKEGLKEKIQWLNLIGASSEACRRLEGFINQWINNNDSLERLSFFVMAVTGLTTLPNSRIKLSIYSRDKAFYPKTHTCSCTMDLSTGWESQEEFNEKLEVLLAQTKDAGGFSAG